MEINDNRNKSKVAIVAVGYNRVDSLERLFSSLLNAVYPSNGIPLYISIDCSGDTELYEYVRCFVWPYGDKYVNIQEERLGLRRHIIQCGNLTNYFKAIILLEDDIFVSPFFYEYTLKAIDYYGGDDRIAGISLYKNEMRGTLPISLLNNGFDSYLEQSVASWGECWTSSQWAGFYQWYLLHEDDSLESIDMPNYMKAWKKAWSKFFVAYLIETDKFFVYPAFSHTTCFSEIGENGDFASTIGQANLLMGKRDYNFAEFNKLVQYDVYGTNKDVYSWIGLHRDQICVDFYGENPNLQKKRYILTPIKLPYEIEKSFALSLVPIELNIKYAISGNGLYLYDTHGHHIEVKTKLPVSFAFYSLRNFNFRLLLSYIKVYLHNYCMRKTIKLCKKIRIKR